MSVHDGAVDPVGECLLYPASGDAFEASSLFDAVISAAARHASSRATWSEGDEDLIAGKFLGRAWPRGSSRTPLGLS